MLMYKGNPNLNAFRVKVAGKWATVNFSMIPGANMDTFGRFSGRMDMNRMPIFEGDLIEFVSPTEFGSYRKMAGVMVYDEFASCFFIDVFTLRTDNGVYDGSCENPVRIGNIYDNPEKIEEYAKLYGGKPAHLCDPAEFHEQPKDTTK